MRPIPIIRKKKPAEVTTPGGLYFVSTTLPLTPWKDRDDEHVHDDCAHV